MSNEISSSRENYVVKPGESLRYHPPRRHVPLAAYITLATAVLAVSSAAVVFRKVGSEYGTPPVTLAAWRLQLTTALMLPPCIWQARRAAPGIVQDWLRAWWLMAASGVCLAAHFGTWVWGLHHTSVPHALLFVTSVPLLMAGGALVAGAPISRGEVVGAVSGVAAMGLLAFGARSEQEVTLVGDLFSLFGAISIIGYLHAGRYVRSWLPVFMYAFPTTAVSAVVLTAVAVPLEGASLTAAGARGVFGYCSSTVFWYILYLAVGPGIVGHTGFNFLLRYISPFVISMAFPLEPVLGSIMAWVAGVEPMPSALTWIGGALMVGALTYCTYCESKRAAQTSKRRAIEETTADALESSYGFEHMEMAAFTLGDIDDEIVFDSV